MADTKYNSNTPIIFEVTFKRFLKGEETVYSCVDEAVLHKLCVTRIPRSLDKDSVDYNELTAYAYENGFITDDINIPDNTRVG